MAVGDKWTGRNLAITIGGTSVVCPQSLEITPTHEFITYKCTGSDATSKVYDGTDWTGSCTWLPANDDVTEVGGFTSSTLLGVTAYPDGNTSGLLMYTFSAYCATATSTSRGSVATATTTFTISGDVTEGTAAGS